MRTLRELAGRHALYGFGTGCSSIDFLFQLGVGPRAAPGVPGQRRLPPKRRSSMKNRLMKSR